jgi:hypothetical protein
MVRIGCRCCLELRESWHDARHYRGRHKGRFYIDLLRRALTAAESHQHWHTFYEIYAGDSALRSSGDRACCWAEANDSIRWTNYGRDIKAPMAREVYGIVSIETADEKY